MAAALFLFGDGERTIRASLSVAEALEADTTGYARAVGQREFEFPNDHGPHPDYRTEWWYYTGNLTAPSGRRFGYQLTIFRTALRPPGALPPESASDSSWSTRQLYMGHFALSDPEDAAFYAYERFSRGAAGLAGAADRPYDVWLENWRVYGASADTVRLVAADVGVSLDLVLERVKPIVLQGDEGLDQKGPDPGNASYYYSMTRLATKGTLTIGGEVFSVEGLSWLDREWSTSALAQGLVGWDWFSLQLSDGRDLMYYRLRGRDGSTSPFSNGVLVGSDGSVTRLSEEDVALEAAAYWESPVSGARYPVEWSIRIPSRDIDLDLRPLLRQQELDLSVTYWEGAVTVTGSHTGFGFVEMTGYDERGEILAAR